MAFISGTLLTELLGVVFVVFASVYIYFRFFLYNYWKRKGVFYMEPTTPFGNIGSLVTGKASIGELYADGYLRNNRSHRYIGMYAVYKPTLVIADPNLIRHVLTKEFKHFHDRGIYCNEKVDPLSGNLIQLRGNKWRNLRTKLTPVFTSGKMKQIFGTVVNCGDQLTEYLKPKAANREIINTKDLSARFNTDVIMAAAFGINCNSLDNPKNEFHYWGQKAFEPALIWTTLLTLAPQIMDFFSIPVTNVGVAKFFSKAFKDMVEYREANNVIRPDMLSLIMQLMKEDYVDSDDDKKKPIIRETTGGKINMLEGTAQAYIFFLAGFETSSSTITYCLYELACNQDIQEKVMNDIDSVLEKYGGLTYEGLQEMTYLHKVVSETLRKYPSVPFLSRICTEDINLPTTNLHVSKGIDVVIPVLGIHRDPKYYPEPDKFDPERFSELNIAARHSYAYLPFDEGPRLCIGMKFAYAQTKVGLISVLSNYLVRLGPNTPVSLETSPGCIAMKPKGNVELIIENR